MRRTSHAARQALAPLAAMSTGQAEALGGTAQATPLGARETTRPSLPPATRLQITNQFTLTTKQSAPNTNAMENYFSQNNLTLDANEIESTSAISSILRHSDSSSASPIWLPSQAMQQLKPQLQTAPEGLPAPSRQPFCYLVQVIHQPAQLRCKPNKIL